MTAKDKTATAAETATDTAAYSKTMGERAKAHADDRGVPSSTGPDGGGCVILGHLPIDYENATDGAFKEGSPVALPTEILDEMAKRWPDGWLAIVAALMHQPPESACLGDNGRSLFLRWHIVSDERGVREFAQPNGGRAWAAGEGAPLCEDWVGVRIHAWKGHPGALAVHDFFGDASGGDWGSDWPLRLAWAKARALRNGPEGRGGGIDLITGGSYAFRCEEKPFPPLGGNPV